MMSEVENIEDSSEEELSKLFSDHIEDNSEEELSKLFPDHIEDNSEEEPPKLFPDDSVKSNVWPSPPPHARSIFVTRGSPPGTLFPSHHLGSQFYATTGGFLADRFSLEIADRADSLNREVINLRIRVNQLQEKDQVTNQQLETQLSKVVEAVNRVAQRGEDLKELTAQVLVPSEEDLNVRLVPADSLERLDEYRSDENLAYLFIGVFSGAILGVLSNWATNENLVITKFSVLLMGLLFVLTVVGGFWAWRIHKRANVVKERMLRPGVPQKKLGHKSIPPNAQQETKNS